MLMQLHIKTLLAQNAGQLCCCTGSREDGYVLAVNCEWLLEAWQHSALHGLLSSESFTDAFVVSELSVLRYEKTALVYGGGGVQALGAT